MSDGDGEPLVGIGFISAASSNPDSSGSSTSTSIKDNMIDILEADEQVTGERRILRRATCAALGSLPADAPCGIWHGG